jgi:hypothetical protein
MKQEVEKFLEARLLASIFEFNNGTISEYLIYNYKIDKFYPFVPVNEKQKQRNHSEELKIMSALIDEKSCCLKKTCLVGILFGTFL